MLPTVMIENLYNSENYKKLFNKIILSAIKLNFKIIFKILLKAFYFKIYVCNIKLDRQNQVKDYVAMLVGEKVNGLGIGLDSHAG